MTRGQTISAILDASATPCPAIVKRFVYVDAVSGRTYSPLNGLPRGDAATDLVRREYFCFQARDGCTYGKQYASESEAATAHDSRELVKRAEFAAALETMSDKELESQYDYWSRRAAMTARLTA